MVLVLDPTCTVDSVLVYVCVLRGEGCMRGAGWGRGMGVKTTIMGL